MRARLAGRAERLRFRLEATRKVEVEVQVERGSVGGSQDFGDMGEGKGRSFGYWSSILGRRIRSL
jgi:hypothetical protein